MTTTRERPLTIADVPPTCTLSREGGRCCISFVAHDPGTWLALFTSLRREFPRHADMTYRGKERGWSLPGHRRAELEAWVWLHFPEKRVKGSLALTPGCVRGCSQGVCYTSPFGQRVCAHCGYAWPEPGEGTGETLAGLLAERDRTVVELRRMPDRGAVHIALKRRLADLDESISAEIERMAGHD